MTEYISQDRLDNLNKIRELGQNPFPDYAPQSENISQLIPSRVGTIDEGCSAKGRISQIRDFGNLIFASLTDFSGSIQIGFKKDKIPEYDWPLVKLIQANDFVQVDGVLGTSKKGELTVWVTSIHFSGKSLRHPPEKWAGLQDEEKRARMRFVDLATNQELRETLTFRSKLIRTIRNYLDSEDYLEVETPILQPLYGGASARPFTTHHNALDMPLYMRIAPELYLKRLIVGGFERIYEIGKVFRNEGLSQKHNPEFTMLEMYTAWDPLANSVFVEKFLKEVASKLGLTKVSYKDTIVDFSKPFDVLVYKEAFSNKNNGLSWDDVEGVKARATELGIYNPNIPHHKLANDVFELTVEPTLINPTFIIQHPVEISLLARSIDSNSSVTNRFELFICGMEIANGFQELNDPMDQQERLENQLKDKDEESPSEVDYDFVAALEYGMPPTYGVGIGIDRLVMILSGKERIKDVITFPLVRP